MVKLGLAKGRIAPARVGACARVIDARTGADTRHRPQLAMGLSIGGVDAVIWPQRPVRAHWAWKLDGLVVAGRAGRKLTSTSPPCAIPPLPSTPPDSSGGCSLTSERSSPVSLESTTDLPVRAGNRHGPARATHTLPVRAGNWNKLPVRADNRQGPRHSRPHVVRQGGQLEQLPVLAGKVWPDSGKGLRIASITSNHTTRGQRSHPATTTGLKSKSTIDCGPLIFSPAKPANGKSFARKNITPGQSIGRSPSAQPASGSRAA
jgi:hypothetical protein